MKKLQTTRPDIRLLLANLKSGLSVIVAKAKNAEGNNYALGLKYMETGQMKDARFRFWVVTKLNPNHKDAAKKLAEVRAALANSANA